MRELFTRFLIAALALTFGAVILFGGGPAALLAYLLWVGACLLALLLSDDEH